MIDFDVFMTDLMHKNIDSPKCSSLYYISVHQIDIVSKDAPLNVNL